MTESALPVNSMGAGDSIATYDPLLKKTSKKRLRDILKSSPK